MFRHALSGALALACVASAALADGSPRCGPAAAPRAIVEASHGSWIELTSEQRAFIEGVWTMNPATPSGLPYGDKAVLAQRGGTAAIFFIDGDRACDGIVIPDEIVQMLKHVGAGDVYHEGKGS